PADDAVYRPAIVMRPVRVADGLGIRGRGDGRWAGTRATGMRRDAAPAARRSTAAPAALGLTTHPRTRTAAQGRLMEASYREKRGIGEKPVTREAFNRAR